MTKLSESLMADIKNWGYRNLPDKVYTDALNNFVDNKVATAITRIEKEAFSRCQEKGITIQLENSAIKELGLEKEVGKAIRRKIEKEARENLIGEIERYKEETDGYDFNTRFAIKKYNRMIDDLISSLTKERKDSDEK